MDHKGTVTGRFTSKKPNFEERPKLTSDEKAKMNMKIDQRQRMKRREVDDKKEGPTS